MAVLLGDKEVELTGRALIKEKVDALKAGKPTANGTVETIEFWMAAVTATGESELGIYEDEAGKPGKLLAHKKLKLENANKETWQKATGFSVKVETSKEYWLALGWYGGSGEIKYRSKKSAGELISRAMLATELKEGGTWTAQAETANMSIKAEGTEESSSTGLLATKSGESKIVIGGKQTLVAQAALAATSATGKVVIGGTERIVGTAAIATGSAQSKVVVGGTQTLGATAGLVAASAQSKVVIGGKQALSAVAGLVAKSSESRVVVAGKQAIKGIGEAARKAAAIFIFDE